MTDKVSVIIPLYNAKDFIAKAIESLLKQTYPDVEIIVVNDRSTDNPNTLLDKYEGKIKVIHLPENKGPAGARNEGIRNASGSYISFLDSDDFYHPDKIKTETEFLKNHSEVDWIYSKTNLIDNDNSVTGIFPEYALDRNEAIPEGNIYHRLFKNNFLPVNSVLIRKHVFKDILFDENLIGIEDWDLFIRIAEKHPIKFLDRCLSSILYRPDSLQRNIIKFQTNIIKLSEKVLHQSYLLTKADMNLINKRLYTAQNALGKEYYNKKEYSLSEKHFLLSIKGNMFQKRPYWFLMKILFKKLLKA